MGVHDFTSTFEPTASKMKFADLKNEDYAVDAYTELFRGTTMQYAAKLTNPAGEPTLHLNVALSNAVKRRALGCHDIWCWDSRDPRDKNDAKNHTIEKRKNTRQINIDEIKKIEADIEKLRQLGEKVQKRQLLQIDPTFDATLLEKCAQLEVLRARNPDAQHFSNMIRDVMFINEKLGIQQAIAPAGCDAEKLAAQLCREKLVDGVITVDTDAIPYGATKQIKKRPKETGVYDVFVLADILKKYDITERQLAEICTVLGCDDADKTPGVGAKTVIRKIKEGKIKFTEKQIEAQNKYLDRTPVKYEYIDAKMTERSIGELEDWLIRAQGFSQTRVEKMLKPMRDMLKK